jgi:hypothetical protein
MDTKVDVFSGEKSLSLQNTREGRKEGRKGGRKEGR